MKNSYLTATDQFCGAGGSSQGARKAGVEVKLALNHWKLAIETHNTNFPFTLHDCTDISACDPRRYPSTDILITSPECTTHSPAGGNRHKKVKETMDLFDKGLIDPSTERSRATMWDVCRFAEYHQYNAIVVENVVEARTRWVLFDVWLQAMHRLGYNHRCLYLNSMHFWPTPQSRDRMYVVFWKKGNKAPNLDYYPLAHCSCCGKDVHAVQTWKNPLRKFGKYGAKNQYIYCCPTDGTVVEPYYYAAFNAIDWSDLGAPVFDRPKQLSEKTIARIKWGLDRYGNEPTINPFIISTENGSQLQTAKTAWNPFDTQTTSQAKGIVTPWIIEMNKTGECKPANNPFSTITAGGLNHAILGAPILVQNKGQSMGRSTTDAMNAITTKVSNGIVTHESWSTFIQYYYKTNQSSKITEPIGAIRTKDGSYLINYQKPKIEDCYYRMLKAPEVKISMAFDPNYIILGNSRDQVKQCGNAVTPPVQEWIIGQVVESLS